MWDIGLIQRPSQHFLLKQIKKKDSLEIFIEEQTVGHDALSRFVAKEAQTTALPFQTGYLIIKGKEESAKGSSYAYKLDFPNFKVKNAFLISLLKTYKQSTNIKDKVTKSYKD